MAIDDAAVLIVSAYRAQSNFASNNMQRAFSTKVRFILSVKPFCSDV